METASKKTLSRLCDIFSIKAPESLFDNTDKVIEVLKMHKVYDDSLAILSFMKACNRDDINPFLYKLQKLVSKHIEQQDFYLKVDISLIQDETNALRKSLQYNKMKYYAHAGNHGKCFLSLDIRAANFMALKKIGGPSVSGDWPTYFNSIVPNDTRGSGEVTAIPDCIYSSKYLRQFLLGSLTKLKYIWELENLKQLQRLLTSDVYNEKKNPVYVQSDEIVVLVNDYQEADRIIKSLNVDPIYRIRKFILQNIESLKGNKNRMIRLFSDGSKTLINVAADEYNELYKKYIASI